MTIKQIQAYTTPDGRVFQDLDEAAAHEYVLSIKNEVNDWAGDGYRSLGDVSTVLRWEQYRKLKELRGAAK